MRLLTEEEKADCCFLDKNAEEVGRALPSAFIWDMCPIQPRDFSDWAELYLWLMQIKEEDSQDE